MQPLLILFAKAPVPGRVKTRLQTILTADEASALHEAFVEDMLAILASLALPTELHVDQPTAHWPAERTGVAHRLQCEGDMGERMRHALEDGLARGHSPVAIVGSDAPDLPAGCLRELVASGAASGADVTLGPADDGGYYAIVCRRTHPGMFQGVRWSTENAFHDTLRACQASGLTIASGRMWHDVDVPQDLERLVNPGPHTQAWLDARRRTGG